MVSKSQCKELLSSLDGFFYATFYDYEFAPRGISPDKVGTDHQFSVLRILYTFDFFAQLIMGYYI